MQMDKNTLSALAALDDASLSAAIRMLAASAGLSLGEGEFAKPTLDALRGALRGATDADIAKAKQIFEGFKNGRK